MATTPASVSPPAPSKPAEIAPRWHTALLVLALLVLSFAGAKSHGQLIGKHGRLPLYILTIAWQYVLLGYICFGVWRRGGKVRDLIGGRWNEVEDFLLDVAIAAGYWLISLAVLGSLLYLFGFYDPKKMEEARKSLSFMVPQSRLEAVLWIALSVTAGFCEEIIFRGYLLRQFAGFSGSITVGIVAQAVLFGMSHGYEGPQRMIVIAVWGTMFGLLAQWRKSLRPGMMAHGFHDTIAGLLGSIASKTAH